ncbi:hypothetical protein MPSD_18500 [Mycobacterium pseudoshottsii JCM 15466]|uniref:Uncharacterized protein n=1 Tax=Mycobacterium pseudoshottsii TaxID=265949 RepID=A0A9N7LTH5_9MYCO|nr:hypothetical protein MPSD_18500 [Mycobacterium pseudoshottsii JCM 15466]BDN81614.1 hypothetical protein NJB1907Z4_C18290 [Mycobacterium pseudoshottsii]
MLGIALWGGGRHSVASGRNSIRRRPQPSRHRQTVRAQHRAPTLVIHRSQPLQKRWVETGSAADVVALGTAAVVAIHTCLTDHGGPPAQGTACARPAGSCRRAGISQPALRRSLLIG